MNVGRAATQSNGGARERGEDGELCVVVACHSFVCAIPVRMVARLVLADEVTFQGPSVVEVGGESFALWDLGNLLGLPSLESSFVLMHIRRNERAIPIALRTGPCLVVQHVRSHLPLPAGAFHSRGAGFLGAFSSEALKGRVEPSVIYGIVVEPQRLFSERELMDSASRVAGAQGGAT